MDKPGRIGQETVAGVSGVASGTVLLELAQNLPDGNKFKSYCVILAPSVSVAFTLVGRFVAREITDRWLYRQVIRKYVEAVAFHRNIHSDPTTSRDDRQHALDALSRLNREHSQYMTERSRANREG